MKIPTIRGLIDRRLLVNYRADPAVVAALLPSPFRPKTIHGFAMVGICLIRLKEVRPTFMPHWIGISSENAAHRTAVEWDDNGTIREGVYVRRRDTDSRLNALAGGQVFPGIHHHARFTVAEEQGHFDIAVQSDDDATSIRVRGTSTDALPTDSIFKSIEEASSFFQGGSLGYSATPESTRFQGLELRCHSWKVTPVGVEEVRSSFFDDVHLFPKGSIQFDCALLMRDIEHEWHGKPDLCSDAGCDSHALS